jgi:hypothetical protein
MNAGPASANPTLIDRYELHGEIASGGMARVHLGRLVGPGGFGRTVAIKRLHPHLAKEPEFVNMLTDEARVAGRLGHPNLVSTLDIVAADGELFLVMEYIPGLTLSVIARRVAMRGERIPLPIALSIMIGVLHGVHAVHEAHDEQGRPLEVVHRDVSPQNVLVGIDGVPRVLDFGIAKAAGRLHTTRDGQLKGKVGYMAPEQLGGGTVDRRTDIYAASVCLWEMLTGQRLFDGEEPAAVFGSVMQKRVPPPGAFALDLPAAVDQVVIRGLEREPLQRYPDAREMALELEGCGPLATASAVGAWIAALGEDVLEERAQLVADIEAHRSAAVTQVFPASAADALDPTAFEAAPKSGTPRSRVPTALVLGILVGAAGVSALFGARWRARASGPSAVATEPRVASAIASAAAAASVRKAEPFPEAALTSTGPGPGIAKGGNGVRSVPKGFSRAGACSPPFWIDAEGHKRYKVNCL